jgi:DNA-binding XRE family transcriptional regulator
VIGVYDRWRRLCGYNKQQAADILGISLAKARYVWEIGEHPRGGAYAMAWIMLWGDKHPWEMDEIGIKIREVRTKFRITTNELADLMGLYRTDILRFQNGRKRPPLWIRYALSWLLFYGSRLPFQDETALPHYRRCPTCGR